jgi:hypothetical protein
MAVLLIALLAAFLTVVQVWQIPEPENPLTTQKQTSAQGSPGGAQTAGTQTTGTKSAFDPSPFASNFGKTVITGLGGLAAATALKSLEGTSTPEDSKFYIVWFIVLFFFILAVSAALRAFGEALRERVSIFHAKFELPPRKVGERPTGCCCQALYWLLRFVTWVLYWSWYWLRRFARWLLSLRFWLLTFIDTFINLIQGKNQTLTRLFSDTIIKQQRNVVCVAQVMRQQLNDMLLQHLNMPKSSDSEKSKGQEPTEEKKPGGEEPDPENSARQGPPTEKKPGGEKKEWLDPRDVRVNISVLSADQSKVFYIARTPGSGLKAFTKRSVAWVSVFTGKIRWYKHDYFDEEIVLFNNSRGVIPDGESNVMLKSYYQEREDDYEAFIIFPIPWPQRAFGTGYVKGAIHISFRRQKDFDEIWKFRERTDKERESLAGSRWEDLQKRGLDKTDDPVLLRGSYKSEDEEKMLGEWCHEEVKACLRQALAILGQLLYDFNENIYNSSQQAGDCGSS